jgi:hypothetical protein
MTLFENNRASEHPLWRNVDKISSFLTIFSLFSPYVPSEYHNWIGFLKYTYFSLPFIILLPYFQVILEILPFPSPFIGHSYFQSLWGPVSIGLLVSSMFIHKGKYWYLYSNTGVLVLGTCMIHYDTYLVLVLTSQGGKYLYSGTCTCMIVPVPVCYDTFVPFAGTVW